jgi:prophage regulatory protein
MNFMVETDIQTNNGQSYYQPINILRLPEVIKRIGLCRASIYLHMAQGTFPKQISLGARAVGWIEHEINAWLAARVSSRNSLHGESV